MAKSKKDRRINNGRHIIIKKTKYRAARTPLKTGVNAVAQKGYEYNAHRVILVTNRDDTITGSVVPRR